MLFTFRRDEEGRETIYVGDVCVAEMCKGVPHHHARFRTVLAPSFWISHQDVVDAIGRADDAGFWQAEHSSLIGGYAFNEITVDVPIAETSTTLTLVRDGDDEA